MIEVRLHGRGGQGAVTASELIAHTAYKCGLYVQSFPMFGVERRGAPVEAYVRIDEKPILTREQVYNPNYVLCLDSSLIKSIDITKGLNKKGIIIINSNKNPEEFNLHFRTITADLTKIALETIKAPITNTAMVGAFSGATNLIKINEVAEAIKYKFGDVTEL
ncbi:MAG: 2-oxoacid:acceptor oxidoreductase family protein, partial [Candidatus Nanoarchaeia archaeon]|nr:2-oxoacid:acceptor oxidoreductase family protein [Candidatus Nanoarchaeia archaeon]